MTSVDPIPSRSEKAAGPVTPQELESLSLRIAQAASTLRILNEHPDRNPAELQNALGLLTDYLDECAYDLSDLHARHEGQQEAQP